MFAFYAKVKFNRERLAFQNILYRIQEGEGQQRTLNDKLNGWPKCTLQMHGEFSKPAKELLESMIATGQHDIERDVHALENQRRNLLAIKARLQGTNDERAVQVMPVAAFN